MPNEPASPSPAKPSPVPGKKRRTAENAVTITADTWGTPQQPPIPAGQFGKVAAGVYYDSQEFLLPSAALVGDYLQYWNMVYGINHAMYAGAAPDWTKIDNGIAISVALSQEWVNNPQSGHNLPLEG